MKKSTKYLAIMALFLSIVINYGCPGIFGYNVVGTWSVTATFDIDNETEDYTISFAGDKKSGTVTWTAFGYSLSGTYSVNGKNITFEVGDEWELDSFTGTFNKKDEMSGTGTLLWYSDASPDARKMKRMQTRMTNAQSESYTFTWIGFRN